MSKKHTPSRQSKNSTSQQQHDKKKDQAVARFRDLMRTVTARVDLAPDYVEITSHDEWTALEDAFIAGRMAEDAQQKLGPRDAWERDEEDLQNELGEQRCMQFLRIIDRHETLEWVRQEIVFAMGIEIGRRMGGAR